MKFILSMAISYFIILLYYYFYYIIIHKNTLWYKAIDYVNKRIRITDKFDHWCTSNVLIH